MKSQSNLYKYLNNYFKNLSDILQHYTDLESGYFYQKNKEDFAFDDNIAKLKALESELEVLLSKAELTMSSLSKGSIAENIKEAAFLKFIMLIVMLGHSLGASLNSLIVITSELSRKKRGHKYSRWQHWKDTRQLKKSIKERKRILEKFNKYKRQFDSFFDK